MKAHAKLWNCGIKGYVSNGKADLDRKIFWNHCQVTNAEEYVELRNARDTSLETLEEKLMFCLFAALYFGGDLEV